jgi:CheY-like chemotaxis protein
MKVAFVSHGVFGSDMVEMALSQLAPLEPSQMAHWTCRALDGRFNRRSRKAGLMSQSPILLVGTSVDVTEPERASVSVCPSSTVGRAPSTIQAGTRAGAQTAVVLIVDDDSAIVDAFSQVLRLQGYEVRTALSAEDGMRAVPESRPDAILLDYNLRLANGIDFLRWLRACEAHRDIPVAIVTADDSLNDILGTELDHLGASLAFKPLCVAELVDLTSRLLAGRQSLCKAITAWSRVWPFRLREQVRHQTIAMLCTYTHAAYVCPQRG